MCHIVHACMCAQVKACLLLVLGVGRDSHGPFNRKSGDSEHGPHKKFHPVQQDRRSIHQRTLEFIRSSLAVWINTSWRFILRAFPRRFSFLVVLGMLGVLSGF